MSSTGAARKLFDSSINEEASRIEAAWAWVLPATVLWWLHRTCA